ncbi:hypothetical protein BH23ACT9_BH23ACT9_34120 [soil metagenome]
MTDDTTTAATAVDLLGEIRVWRAEEARIRILRSQGAAGYSDLSRAQYRLQLALLAAEEAGLLARPFTVDTAAMLSISDPGDGRYGFGA